MYKKVFLIIMVILFCYPALGYKRDNFFERYNNIKTFFIPEHEDVLKKYLEERYPGIEIIDKTLKRDKSHYKEKDASRKHRPEWWPPRKRVKELVEEFENPETTAERRRQIIRELQRIGTVDAVTALDKWLNNDQYKEFHSDIVGALEKIALNFLRWGYIPPPIILPPYPPITIPVRPGPILPLSDIFLNSNRQEELKESTAGENISEPDVVKKNFLRPPWSWWRASFPAAQKAVSALLNKLIDANAELAEEITDALLKIAKTPAWHPFPWKPIPIPPPVIFYQGHSARSINNDLEPESWEEFRNNWQEFWKRYYGINVFSYQILYGMEYALNRNEDPESQKVIEEAINDLRNYLKDHLWWPPWWYWPPWPWFSIF